MLSQPVDSSGMLRILAACGLAVVLAMGLRYGYIDNDGVRNLCYADASQWFCPVRAILSDVLRHWVVGIGIAAFALGAVFTARVQAISAVLVLCAAGLVLFQADLASGAAAVLLLVLALPPQSAGE